MLFTEKFGTKDGLAHFLLLPSPGPGLPKVVEAQKGKHKFWAGGRDLCIDARGRQRHPDDRQRHAAALSFLAERLWQAPRPAHGSLTNRPGAGAMAFRDFSGSLGRSSSVAFRRARHDGIYRADASSTDRRLNRSSEAVRSAKDRRLDYSESSPLTSHRRLLRCHCPGGYGVGFSHQSAHCAIARRASLDCRKEMFCNVPSPLADCLLVEAQEPMFQRGSLHAATPRGFGPVG